MARRLRFLPAGAGGGGGGGNGVNGGRASLFINRDGIGLTLSVTRASFLLLSFFSFFLFRAELD
jgi:hypothetical protein